MEREISGNDYIQLSWSPIFQLKGCEGGELQFKLNC